MARSVEPGSDKSTCQGARKLISGDRNMRIARISTVPYFMVSQLAGQIECLVRSGASVTVITSDGPELGKLREDVPSLHLIPVEIPRRISPAQDMKALRQLYAIFRREKFNIIHSTTPKAGLLSAIAGRLAGVPVRLHTFTGQPWVYLSGPMRWFARRSDWLIGKLNTRCYTDSASQRQFLIRQGIVSADRLFVIGAGSIAGVDLARFSAARFPDPERAALKRALGIPLEAAVLLFVGRITADKGINELNHAFRRLRESGHNAHLLLVGPFDSDLGSGDDGISRRDFDNVEDTHIVGYTECPEQYMAIADILCLPSYREGFGTVVIEAAAMGVPTVGTDIYGLTDAVVQGETGILVPPRDASALEHALQRLLEDNAQRLRMGQAARRRAQELFEAGQVNEKVIKEYGRLLEPRKPADA